MKHTKLTLTFLIAVVAVGCGNSSNGDTAANQPATTATQPTVIVAPAPSPATQPSTTVTQTTTTVTQPVVIVTPSAASSDPTTSTQVVVITQTAPDLKDYTYTQKDEYFKAMQAKMDGLNQELALLSAKIEHASDATKAAGQPKLDAAQLQIDKFGTEMDDAKNATESIWGDAKVKVQRAYDDANQTYHDVSDWTDQQPLS